MCVSYVALIENLLASKTFFAFLLSDSGVDSTEQQLYITIVMVCIFPQGERVESLIHAQKKHITDDILKPVDFREPDRQWNR